jgi:hypothetical protein
MMGPSTPAKHTTVLALDAERDVYITWEWGAYVTKEILPHKMVYRSLAPGMVYICVLDLITNG